MIQPVPDGILLPRDRRAGPPRSTTALILLTVLLAAALLGLLGGGRSPVVRAMANEAELSVDSPAILRSGLFFEQDVEVIPHRAFDDAVIGVSAALWKDMTINSMIPAAAQEEFADGEFRLHFGPLAAGESLILKIDGQINPPLTVGTRGAFRLYDGKRRIATVPISMKVLP